MKKLGGSIRLIVFTIIIIAFVAFSMLASLHIHNCVGDDCPVCQLLGNTNRLISNCSVPSLALVCACTFSVIIYLSFHRNASQSNSPVSQRDKITS